MSEHPEHDTSGGEAPAPPPTPAPPERPSPGEPAPDDTAGVQRTIRRTTRRRVETEHVDEEITEVLPPQVYAAPSTTHPAPVG